MRVLQVLLLVLPLGLPAAAWAQRSPVLVELYTSQGCSSCPPADALFADLAAKPDVIALALHVDYWDYLGWEDKFARPEHTDRQRKYAKAARERSIYTPQLIVQGVDRVVGADAEAVLAAISAHQARPVGARLRLERDDAVLRIRLAPAADSGPSVVYLVRFQPRETVEIADGENAGQTIDYTNIVSDWSAVARWDGLVEAEFGVDLGDGEPGAVVVQRERLGPVLTAAMLP